jgi:hypothetical protein
MKMNNNLYDILKWIALVALDAVGLFYQTLSAIWNLPYGDQVLSTCVAISVCLGTLLQISSKKYKGGE